MRSKKNFFIGTLAVGLFSAFVITGCSSDESVIEQAKDGSVIEQANVGGLVDVLGVEVELKNNTLALSSENELQDLVSKLKNNQYVSTRQSAEVVTNKGNESLSIDGFTSLYDVFVDAMMNAESYYDREGGYEEFKEKYSTLYFPETEDDISAYLPVSDPYLSKFLNKDGEIIIAGETINMKDISSYEQLEELNLTPLMDAEDETITTRQSGIPMIGNWWGGEPRLITVGTSTVIGQRKIGVDNCKVIKKIGVIYAGFDIVFRKRGFLNAWYNHWALTKNKIYIFLPQQNYEDINPSSYFGFIPQTHEGYSSHEEQFATEDWFTSVKNFNFGAKKKRVSIQVQIYYDALRAYSFYVPIINYEWDQ